MDFKTKIAELDFIYTRLQAERVGLQARKDHDLNMQMQLQKIKTDQVQLELRKLDEWRNKMNARNLQLQSEVRTANSANLELRKEQLYQAKQNFIEAMARKDPQWQERVLQAQEKEVERMKLNQQKLESEIQDRQRQLYEERNRQQELKQLREDADAQRQQLKDLQDENAEMEKINKEIKKPTATTRVAPVVAAKVATMVAGIDAFQQPEPVKEKQRVQTPINQQQMILAAALPFSQQDAVLEPISNRGQQIDDDFAALLNRKSQEPEAPKRKPSDQVPVTVLETRPEKQQSKPTSPVFQEIKPFETKKVLTDQFLNAPSDHDQEVEKNSEYYEEQEASQSDAQSTDPRIQMPASRRIDDLVEQIEIPTKTMLAGVLLDYISRNLDGAQTTLFERTRETGKDREMKFKLVETYNRLLDKMCEEEQKEFDLGIACDFLLDLLRYESSEILNAAVIVQDYRQQRKKSLLYSIEDFTRRIKDKYLGQIVKGIFKLIVQAMENQCFKSLQIVSRNLTDALIHETQLDSKMDLAEVVQSILEAMAGTNLNILGATSRSQKSNKSSGKAALVSSLSDGDRIAYAQFVVQLIEEQTTPYQNPKQILTLLSQAESIKMLNNKQKTLTNDQAAAVLILLLKTRTEQNINGKALAYCEESGDFGDFSGLIASAAAKKLFDMLIKHYGSMISRRQLKQSEAELFIFEACANWKCDKSETEVIKQFIVDTLNMQIRVMRTEKQSNIGSIAGDSYNQQFTRGERNGSISQQPVIIQGGGKSKLKSSAKKIVSVEAFSREQKHLAEMDQPEINDDDFF